MLMYLLLTTLAVHAASAAFIDQTPDIVNQFWERVTKDPLNLVSRTRLENHFRRYDDDGVYFDLFINTTMFLTRTSWTSDFNLTQEVGKANFQQLDRWTGSDVTNEAAITLGDLNIHIEYVADLDGDNLLNETEFKTGYGKLLRSLPFSVMFSRYDGNADDYLTEQEFNNIHIDINTKGDGNIDESEMQAFFVNGGYTNATFGKNFFRNLMFYGFSSNNATIDLQDDWPNLFNTIDVSGPGAELNFLEFEALDDIMHKDFEPENADGKSSTSVWQYIYSWLYFLNPTKLFQH